MHLIVVDDIFAHYSILYDDREKTVYAECERCDDIVASLSYESVVDLDEMGLYEEVVKQHEPL